MAARRLPAWREPEERSALAGVGSAERSTFCTLTMALSIKHPEADRLARELARTTGETLTEAVVRALRERLVRETGRRQDRGLAEEVRRMQMRIARLPRLDDRADEALLGYDAHGLPH